MTQAGERLGGLATASVAAYLACEMSLIAFHKLLIATAILFCAMFAAWQGVVFVRTGSLLGIALAIAFALAAAALAYYLANLRRFLKRDV